MRFIIIMLMTYLAYKFLMGLFITKGTQQRHVPRQPGQSASGEDLVEDPYCHTYIPLSNALKTSVQGKTVHFCSKKCLEEFTAIQENRT
jgi:YHS domain-containing protein